jgi:crotonobetainyl-CoA:carnitine CoA-transferase CaiB-like acyl-CoA transferase
VQAASGLASLQARSGGDMRYLPTIVADKTTALVAVQAILAALLYRERHGQGQQVEVPMFETMAGWVAVEHLWGHSWSPSRGGSGYPRVLSPDRRPYRARDGAWLSVLPYMDRHWAVFWDAAGHPELLGDPRFGSVADRLFHIDDCYAAIAAAIAEKDASEWLALLAESCVPITRVNEVDDLLDDPHLLATGFWQQHDHPSEGTLRFASPPYEFSATPAEIRRLPPRLGEHSRELLREAGLDEARIDALCVSGVIGTIES